MLSNTLKNETPYDISYMGVNDLKKDSLILAGLIASEALPFVGWLVAATEGAYEVKLAKSLAQDIQKIMEFIRSRLTREIINDNHLMCGILKPLQSGQYSNESHSSVEMLVQIVTLTDTVI